MTGAEAMLLDGRFELLDELGEGAFGQVFRARDRTRDAIVALKRLARFDADSLYRFKREFRVVADIAHPNVVTLYELFAESGAPFFTMELVAGTDFVTWVRRLPPSSVAGFGLADTLPASSVRLVARAESETTRLRSVLRQLVSAVHALHDAGMIHRDLKPSNVLVRNDGHVVVLDFGLVVGPDNTRSAAMGAGTPGYMAPEQARGEKVGPAADWYAVGGMLYEALTGRLPFDGSPFDVLHRKQTEVPPHPSSLVASAPADLSDLCIRLLAPDPVHRPTGLEILADIGEAPPRVDTPRQEFFLGRQHELAMLDEAFEAIQPGRPSVAIVHGPSGIGKTALLRSYLERAAATGALLLTGRCFEREQVPFKGLDSLIESLTRHLSELRSVDAAVLMPRDVDALVRLFPALLRVEAVARGFRGRSNTDDPVERRRRGARALRELLQRCSDAAKTILVIDDVQWSDVDSAMILADVLLPPDAPSIMLLLAYRDEEDGNRTIEAAVPRDHVRMFDVALGPLDEASASELVRETGAGSDVGLVVRESGGNPFFLRELARASGGGTSVSLGDVVLQRVHRLSEDAQRVLQVVAVAGQPIAREIAMRAAAVSGDVALEVMTTLRRESLVRTRGKGEIEAYHDRIREALVASLRPETLRTLHGDVAAALDATAPPQLMAYHLRMSGDHERARAFAEAAGDHALRSLAFERAAHHFSEAASGDRVGPELLEKQAEALIGAGRGREAATTLLRASAMVQGEASSELRRRAVEQYFRTGLFEDGLETIRPLLQDAALSIPGARWVTVVLIYWNILLLMLGWRMTPRVDPLARRRARLCQTLSNIGNYDSHRSLLFIAMGARYARTSGDAELHAQLLIIPAVLTSNASMMTTIAARAPSANESERRTREAWIHWAEGFSASQRGQVTTAMARLQEAERGFDGGHLAYERGITRTWLLEMMWRNGELREYLQRGRDNLLEYRLRGDTFSAAWTDAGVLRRILLIEDQPSEARALAERWGAMDKSPDNLISFIARCGACECAIYEDDATAAQAARLALERTARSSVFMSGGAKSPVRGFALGCMGTAALVEGNVRAATRVLRPLERERAFGTHVLYASIIRAGLAEGSGVAGAYDRTAAELEQEYPMHAEAARFRAAEARGDEAAAAKELASLSLRGAVNPRVFAALLTPRLKR